MSFTQIPEVPARRNRSELAVPGSQTRFFAKAIDSAADVIFLDLEDSVAPDEKPQARKNVIEALNDLDWSSKTVSVRINGLDTPFMYRDVVDIVEQAGQWVDLIMIPKVGCASDVYALDMLVSQIENAKGLTRRIGFELIIESVLGVQNAPAIAAASPRNESLHFGVADYAASAQARTTNIGGPSPDYAVLTDADADGQRAVHWDDVWHYPLSRMVIAARTAGLRPIDGPFGNYSDPDGYLAAARRAAALGCEGKWAIHPSQIDLANTAMSPSEDELIQARRILTAMEDAEQGGMGAATLDGKLIDYASIRQAQAIVARG